jgi:hypothetical protein
MTTRCINKHFRPAAVLLALLISLGGWAENLDSSKKKEINQWFSLGANDQLDVDNRYGNIIISHWTKNEIAIRVVIESKAANDRLAQEGLDRVQIEMKKRGNTVYAATSFRNQMSNNSSINIDYYISMPPKLAAALSQMYGNITMPEHNEGKCDLEVKYGNIQAGSFSEPLSIDAGYSNIHIGDVNELEMSLAYCGNVALKNARSLSIDSKYSNLNIRNADKIEITNRYGNIKIQDINSLFIETKYGNADINSVKEELNIDAMDYSTLELNELNDNFKHVNAEARYGTLKLSISVKASFQVIAEDMKYGSVDIKGLKITGTQIENKTNYHYRINGGGNRLIRFEGNSYSNLKINAL